MFILKVKGARNTTLAIHHCETYSDLQEMMKVYEALGHKSEALLIEEGTEEQAA
ncbi:MAG: hypothetical protein NVSMB52_01540 [Chloroflexota bacterium]